ncbi:MAG: ABC transporter permease [Lachnospiraceae bacterium]|nr:ABC transporter permease [Lachnospiraceae bacterium]
MYIIARNIARNKKKSLITILVCTFLVTAVNIYLGNMQSNRNQLMNLPEVMPVYCQITNLNGSKSTGIWIDEVLAGSLITSSQVKDAAYGIRMMGGIGDFPDEERREMLTLSVEGVSCMEAVPGLTWENLELNQGEDSFFQSSDAKCIVSSALMKKQQWKRGQEIPLNLYYYDYNDEEGIHCYPLEILNVTIVGEMDIVAEGVGAMPPDILIPIGLLRESYARENVPFQPSHFSFYVADPLALNDFKAEMKALGLMERNVMANDSFEGCALNVRDTVFVSMADKLQKTIQIFESFLGIICLTILGVAYIVSTLLMDSRVREFALIRAMGSSTLKCMAILWTEQLCLILTGFLIGDAICLLFQNISTVLFSDAMIAVPYMAGCTVALLRTGKRSTMQLLFAAQ